MWGVVGLKACPFGLEKGHRTRVSVHVPAREKNRYWRARGVKAESNSTSCGSKALFDDSFFWNLQSLSDFFLITQWCIEYCGNCGVSGHVHKHVSPLGFYVHANATKINT